MVAFGDGAMGLVACPDGTFAGGNDGCRHVRRTGWHGYADGCVACRSDRQARVVKAHVDGQVWRLQGEQCICVTVDAGAEDLPFPDPLVGVDLGVTKHFAIGGDVEATDGVAVPVCSRLAEVVLHGADLQEHRQEVGHAHGCVWHPEEPGLLVEGHCLEVA